jgi:hypothetical protein
VTDAEFVLYRAKTEKENAIWVIFVKQLEEGDGPRPAAYGAGVRPAAASSPYSSLFPQTSGKEDMFTVKGFVTNQRPFGVSPAGGK